MSSRGNPWGLVVADLDGTLIPDTTAAKHLDAWLGHGPVVDELEHRFVRGEMTNAEVAANYAPFYRDVALADAEAAMMQVPGLDDIAVGVGLLGGRGIDAVIATVSWSFTAAALAELWGFTGGYGTELEVDGTTGRFTGRVSRHCEPEDKVGYVADRCRRLGIGLDRVVALGDGRSDLPLFHAVGFSVAVNASSGARAAASTVVDTRSFLDALRAVPGLVDQPTA